MASAIEEADGQYIYEPTRLLYVVERTYTPDFVVTTRCGREFYVEAKGYFTSADRSKLLRVVEAHPGIDLRLVFQRASNKLRGSRTTYAEWADKHGFQWAEGTVPEAWINDEE